MTQIGLGYLYPGDDVAIEKHRSRQGGLGKAAMLDRELALVESNLRRVLSSDVGLLHTAADLLVRAGGKRLRPTILLLAYHAAGGARAAEDTRAAEDNRGAVSLATAVELLHTASLVHDDINDHSELRR
ncbi:MAG: polyprenyl synthetase family protein, partial [Anaerolineae bacterium]